MQPKGLYLLMNIEVSRQIIETKSEDALYS